LIRFFTEKPPQNVTENDDEVGLVDNESDKKNGVRMMYILKVIKVTKVINHKIHYSLTLWLLSECNRNNTSIL